MAQNPKVLEWHWTVLENNLKSLEWIVRGADLSALTTYRDGGTGWTVLEVLCHLRDIEATVLQRAHVTVELENGMLPKFDADERAAAERYNQQDVFTVLDALKTNRSAFLEYQRARDERDWQRTGIHPSRGVMTLLDQLIFAIVHDSIHIEQITRILYEKRLS